MKTKNLFRLLAAMLLISVSFTFFGFKSGTPLKKSVSIVRVKKAPSKKMISYFFKFYDGYEFIVTGRGSATSGTFTSYIEGCINGVFVTSGTCSGTFSISGGVCTININITPSGYPLEVFSGPSDYSTNPFVITNCGN
jgi:hypothetical protein